MDPIVILHAGINSGSVLLLASLGEIFTERSGVLNLGLEGLMLVGAVTSISFSIASNNPWIGVLAAMIIAGLISQIHALISITFKSDQVVSGLALTFLGTGLSLVFGEGLSNEKIPLLSSITIPVLSKLPILGDILFTNHGLIIYGCYIFLPLAWFYIYRTRPGLYLRATGEYPAAVDAMGINVERIRFIYVFVGGMLSGLSGATIGLLVSPGWYSVNTTSGQGWIAVGLVIFSQWDPIRAAIGSYAFGTLRRLILDIQGPRTLFASIPNPVYYNPHLGFFMKMIPYAFTIIVLVIGSRESMRKRMGAPAALGKSYIRGEH